ncbi:SAF domain-containing protein [Nakamurella multipartita]|uniref:SAF domain-containing protein n=1 Tax=Nakamurella multipartita TaxID=53461 RepID=UPI00145E9815|nr:SAF domain-containing protein [Nakamurella multipartita]
MGLLLVVGLALVSGWLYTKAGQKTPVVVVKSDIAMGEVIERADLSTVEVAGGVTAIAGANLDSVVGQRAAVGLMTGTLLQRSMLTQDHSMPDGMVQVGVAVTGGRLPAGGVTTGDRVQVLALPEAGGTGTAAPKVVAKDAEIFAAMEDPTRAGGFLLTVLVPADEAAGVAGASGSDSAVVVKVPRE